ncbi:MAG TPA: proline dehydrogenase family protein [Mycobacteriales bacterium]|jgi:proline dehydrogenase|nr:proline dehydrogenase family protein [Mycobacteriales bacterium]
MLRRTILAASRSPRLRAAISTMPVSRDVVARFVAGETAEDAVAATRELVGAGLTVSLDHLGEDTTEPGHADAVTKAYLTLLARLDDAGLTGGAEVSVKLSAIGQALDRQMCLDNARHVCEAATAAGTTVTLDMEDHTTTDSTLGILRELRADFPGTGAVIQAYLRRSPGDVEDLVRDGARVRLCKGAYKEPESVAYQSRHEVDLAYVRLLVRLMDAGAYPMVATHDPRLVAIAAKLAERREPGTFEFQMLYGIRPDEQRRLAADGHRVRIYTPYGQEWYGYLMRRLAERPANLAFFLRALATRS